MKGKKVYVATITLGICEKVYDFIVGVYENKNEIKDKIRQDERLLEELEEHFLNYEDPDDYEEYTEYLEECFDTIEKRITEIIIE